MDAVYLSLERRGWRVSVSHWKDVGDGCLSLTGRMWVNGLCLSREGCGWRVSVSHWKDMGD